MSATSNGRVLRIALAASLAVHLVFAAVVYSRPVTAAPEQKPQRTDIIKIQLPPPTPTPPPPKRVLQKPQRRSALARPTVHTVRIAQTHPIGPPDAPPVAPTGDPVPVDSPGPDVAPTAQPVIATPTPKPACSAPDIPAKTLVTQSAVMPDDQSDQGFSGTAKVKVDLDASGEITGASIYESTGSMELDQAAVRAARSSRYAPEERDCKNVSGSYLFVVDFQ